MSALTREQRRAMARALNRAADHFDERARHIDESMARWRKVRPRDPSPIQAATLHKVARDLRTWAGRCWPPA
jgi:hypothetical protein